MDYLFVHDSTEELFDARYIANKATALRLKQEGYEVCVTNYLTSLLFSKTKVIVFTAPVDLKLVEDIVKLRPKTRFIINNHANIASFSSAEIHFDIMAMIDLSRRYKNLDIGMVSFANYQWLNALGFSCVYLPNTRLVSHAIRKHQHKKRIVVGLFGRHCPLKNLICQAVSSILLAKRLRVNLLLKMLGNGDSCLCTIVKDLFTRVAPFGHYQVEFIEKKPHEEILKEYAECDLLMNVSLYEACNLSVAEGIELGVPSICSKVIDYAPLSWIVGNPVDPEEIASVGEQILDSSKYTLEFSGTVSLNRFTQAALQHWVSLIKINSL